MNGWIVTKRACIFLLVGLLFSTSIVAQSSYKAEKITLPYGQLNNMYRIDANVYRSEQPTDTDFKALGKMGIHEVLNLRRWHSDDDEASGVGLKLYRLKMRAGAIKEKQLIEALRIIKNRKAPIVFHCLHGSDRTGAVCAFYRIVFQGVSKKDAISEMIEGGFGFHRIYGNIIQLIEEADIESMKKAVLTE